MKNLIVSLKSKIKNKLCYEKTKDRNINVLDDDIFLVSYPKSGNTWFRFLIGNLISTEQVTFLNMEKLVPAIYGNTNKYLSKIPSPRILKSHEYFDPRYRTVLYLVRDPRAIAVSYFHHAKKFNIIDKSMNFETYLNLFLTGKLDPYGSWKENVGSWLGALSGDQDRFYLIKYEDLIKNTFKELKQIAIFLKVDSDDKRINNAIESSAFEKMRKMEQDQKNEVKVFKNTNLEMPFIRKGKVNDWNAYFNRETLNKINSAFKDIMLQLGYEIDN